MLSGLGGEGSRGSQPQGFSLSGLAKEQQTIGGVNTGLSTVLKERSSNVPKESNITAEFGKIKLSSPKPPSLYESLSAMASQTQSSGIAVPKQNTNPASNVPGKSGTFSLAALAKEHSSSPPVGTPPRQTGVSLAALAQSHNVHPAVSVKHSQTQIQTPPRHSGFSLAELAQSQDTPPRSGHYSQAGLSLAALAQSHSTPPKSEGISLSALAQSQSTPTRPAEVSQPGGISLAALAQSHGTPPRQQQNISLSGLAQSQSSKPVGISLAQLAQQQTGSPPVYSQLEQNESNRREFSLSDLARQHETKDSAQPKIVPKSGINLSDLAKQHSTKLPGGVQKPGLSLSALAQQHSLNQESKGAAQHESIQRGEGTPHPSKPTINLSALASQHAGNRKESGSESIQEATDGMKSLNISKPESESQGKNLRPPPGFKAKQAGPPPGFKLKQTVDLSALAAQHKMQPSAPVPSQMAQVLAAKLTPKPAGKVMQVVIAKPSIFGQALCSNLSKPHQYKSCSYPKFSYTRQMSNPRHSPIKEKKPIKVFDFSTPSPDDIVKHKQKGAFTRTGGKSNSHKFSR